MQYGQWIERCYAAEDTEAAGTDYRGGVVQSDKGVVDEDVVKFIVVFFIEFYQERQALD